MYDNLMSFFGSFLEYIVIMLILAGLAVAGIFTGRAIRKNKDLKEDNKTKKS